MDPLDRLLADLGRSDGDRVALLTGLAAVYPELRKLVGHDDALRWLVLSNLSLDERRPIDVLMESERAAEQVRELAVAQLGR